MKLFTKFTFLNTVNKTLTIIIRYINITNSITNF